MREGVRENDEMREERSERGWARGRETKNSVPSVGSATLYWSQKSAARVATESVWSSERWRSRDGGIGAVIELGLELACNKY